MIDIKSMTIEELEEIVIAYGQSKFRAKQLFEWIHKKLVNSYEEMTNLPKDLKGKLSQDYPLNKIKIVEKYVSKQDGTIKYLFELHDSHIIESVFMQYKHGNSVCISSQVGCRMGCKFCASTIDGLIRNLTAGEMLDQIYCIEQDTGERVSNVVIMGSGEPLEHLDITMRFIELITSSKGQNIGQRHITVSTCGLVPNIYTLADAMLQITLAISLHASTDEKRKQIMPVANAYSMEELLKACRYYTKKTNRRITFEYALIQGQNDSEKDAHLLGKLLRGILCHVNLIPVNPIKERDFKKSSQKDIKVFIEILESYGIHTTLRRKLGADIDAACGQLRRRYIEKAR